MGIFMNLIEGLKPAIKYALKKQKGENGSSNARSVEIPSQLWAMKEAAVDEKTKTIAAALSKLLIKKDLAGDSNIFETIAKGDPIKGRVIRSYVASMALKRDELSIRKTFIQMLLDFTIDGDLQEHINKIISVMGDDPNNVQERLKEVATETFVSLDDADFENALNKIL